MKSLDVAMEELIIELLQEYLTNPELEVFDFPNSEDFDINEGTLICNSVKSPDFPMNYQWAEGYESLTLFTDTELQTEFNGFVKSVMKESALWLCKSDNTDEVNATISIPNSEIEMLEITEVRLKNAGIDMRSIFEDLKQLRKTVVLEE